MAEVNLKFPIVTGFCRKAGPSQPHVGQLKLGQKTLDRKVPLA